MKIILEMDVRNLDEQWGRTPDQIAKALDTELDELKVLDYNKLEFFGRYPYTVRAVKD